MYNVPICNVARQLRRNCRKKIVVEMLVIIYETKIGARENINKKIDWKYRSLNPSHSAPWSMSLNLFMSCPCTLCVQFVSSILAPSILDCIILYVKGQRIHEARVAPLSRCNSIIFHRLDKTDSLYGWIQIALTLNIVPKISTHLSKYQILTEFTIYKFNSTDSVRCSIAYLFGSVLYEKAEMTVTQW